MAASSALSRRLAVTLLVPLAVVVAARFPTPGLQLEDAVALHGLDKVDLGTLGPFAFGLRPFIIAALVVEILAATVWRWRHLRHAGYDGRARLLARAKQLTFALASVQAFFVFRWLDSNQDLPWGPLLPEGAGARLVVAVAPILGSMSLVWLASLIGKYGVGNGFSVLIPALELPSVVGKLGSSLQEHFVTGEGSQVLAPIVFTAAVVAALAVSTARRPSQGWNEHPARPRLLTPASGISPLVLTYTLIGLPRSAVFGGFDDAAASPLEPGTLVDMAVQLSLLVALGALFTWLINRPANVAAFWQRATTFKDEPGSAAVAARAAVRGGLLRALAFVGALGLLGWFNDRGQILVDMVILVVFSCVILDVLGELRFRRLHGALAGVWPVHRPYAVGLVLDALERGGIPACARGLRHGSLLAFWGPYVPVEIFVPEPRAVEAATLLRPLLLPPGPSITTPAATDLLSPESEAVGAAAAAGQRQRGERE